MATPSWDTGFGRSTLTALYPEYWNNIVASWPPILGPTDTTLFDVSENERNATLQNMDPASVWVTNQYGSALSFNGSNQHCTTGSTTGNLGTGDFTLLLLFNWTTQLNFSKVVWSKGRAGTGEFYFYQYQVGEPALTHPAGRFSWLESTLGDKAVAMVRRNDQMEVWSDGVKVTANTDGISGNAVDFANAREWAIGARPNAGYTGFERFHQGTITSIHVQSFALTEESVLRWTADPLAPYRLSFQTLGGEVGAWIPTISGDNDAGDYVP